MNYAYRYSRKYWIRKNNSRRSPGKTLWMDYPHYEGVDENPYLNDFYEDMLRWSFNLQSIF